MKYNLFWVILLMSAALKAQQAAPLLVKKSTDFTVTGKADNSAWNKTAWVDLQQLDEGKKYKTQFKILYSATGIYVAFRGDDEKISSPFQNDFDNLFKGDVFELFFHPDPTLPSYFEYEISPLNKELVLYMTNENGKISGTRPEKYEAARKTKKAVFTQGKAEHHAKNTSWSAEIYLPYTLLNTYTRVPPKSGTEWNANFYRLDYDSGNMVKWAWAPVKSSFHETDKYRPIRFE